MTVFFCYLTSCRQSDKQPNAVRDNRGSVFLQQNIDTLLELASAYVNRPGERKEDLDSAKMLLGKAEIMNKHAPDEITTGRIFFVYSTAFREGGDTATGHRYNNKSVVLLQKHAPSTFLGDAYQEEANYYSLDTDEKIRIKIMLYEKATEQFQLTNNKEKLGYALKYTADLEQLLGNFGKSLFLLNQSLSAYQEIKFKKLQSVYNLMGTVYTNLGDYPNAVKYCLLGVQNAEAEGDTSLDLATTYNRLAAAYLGSNYPKDAIIYGQKALNVALKYKAAEAVYEILIVVIHPLIQNGEWQKVLNVVDDVESKVKPASLTDSIELLTARGTAFITGNQFNNSYKYVLQLQNIIRLHSGNGPNPVLLSAYRCLMLYCLGTKQYAKLHLYASQAIAIARPYGEYPSLKRGYLYLAISDSAAHNFQSAYAEYKEYARITDSTFTQAKNMQFAQLQVAYETDKKTKEITLKQKDIALLKSQNNAQEFRLLKAQTTRNIIIVAAVALLALLSIGYNIQQRHRRKLEKKQIEIDDQNAELKELLANQQKLLTEKEWLVKEIHHRVKNNLQIVISLFNAQSEFTDNPSALKAIKEGRERMQAIAIIHQKLYGPERGSSINMASYIPELLDNLKSSFVELADDLVFLLDVDSVELEVAQAVPIGLILNEAITNSIKYAFTPEGKGNIRIVLKRIGNKELLLKINDGGLGFPPNFEKSQTNSLGLQLIQLFAEQLDGTLTIKNNNGAEVSLLFQQEYLTTQLTLPNNAEIHGPNTYRRG